MLGPRVVADETPDDLTCVYCGKPAWSIEHIFGTQYVKALVEHLGDVDLPLQTHLAERDGPVEETIEGGFNDKGTPTIGFTMAEVCGTCNNEWMRQIDDDAAPWVAPMIRGEGTTLNARGRDRVAAWAAKTAISARPANRPPLPIDQEWADWLLHLDSAPLHWHVWIARYEGSYHWFAWSLSPRILAFPTPGGTPTDAVVIENDSVYATFLIGDLIVQVFGAWEGGILAERTWPGAISIWPDDGNSVEWPQGPSLTDETLWAFVDRLGSPPTD
jgi:hypothetical protein